MPYRLLFGGGLIALFLGAAYMDGPPVAHTGGFGEETCYYCHFDGTLNDGEGLLEVDGVPETYAPGDVYELTIKLMRPGMERGGVQLAARYAEGENEGHQAGTLEATDEALAVDQADGIQYIRHTPEGTEPVAPDTIAWLLTWHAPEAAAGPVVFHAAANAANGDASEFGDAIYTVEVLSGE